MAKKTIDQKIDDLATAVAGGFIEMGDRIGKLENKVDKLGKETREEFKKVNDKLSRIEFSVSGHDRRLDILDDKVRQISVRIGFKPETL